jgi:hypothetical protein
MENITNKFFNIIKIKKGERGNVLKNMKLLMCRADSGGAMALKRAVPAMSLEYFYDKDARHRPFGQR